MSSKFEYLFDRYKPMDLLPPPQGCWRNYIGLATDTSFFANGNQLQGCVISDFPYPDDNAYGSDSEHAAVLSAIDLSLLAGRNHFSMMELGAGWGPWISLAGMVCQREGFKSIKLVGVEADRGKYEEMKKHFIRNELIDDIKIHTRLICGAAWSEDTVLKFPKIPLVDHGAAASETDVEYRGHHVEMLDIPAFALSTICSDLDEIIDIGHWDVQGAELRIAQSSMDFLDSRVRSLQIGTHSRLIEGELLKMFHQMGWDVIVQVPCNMHWDTSKLTLESMTTRDGEIQVRNPKLWTV